MVVNNKGGFFVMLKKPLNEMIKGHKHVEELRKQRGRQPASVFMTQRSKRLLSVRPKSW